MNYFNVSQQVRQISLLDKKIIFILCCTFALSLANAQSSQTFNYTGSVQSWTVSSCISSVTIAAYGAQGGSANSNGDPGGLGAEMVGTFTVTQGQVLTVIVGGQGVSSGSYPGSGGGGGSGVVYNGTAWIIAGGGGGRDYGGYGDASGTTSSSGENGDGCCSYGGSGGTSGGDGVAVGYPSAVNGPNFAYAGRGFNSGNNGSAGQNGYSTPPYSTTTTNGTWGLGGGGGGVGSSYCNCGGGGGGYSGGGAGGINGDGGGGGSYNIGSSQNNVAGTNSGNGSVTISWVSGPLTVSGNIINNILCNAENDGEASGTVSGGGPPYTYSWTPAGGSKDTASGLSAGNYTVNITDFCGHSATASVSITQPAALKLSVVAVTNVLCNGESNGKASSSVSGGSSPYTYIWSDLQLTPVASGLSAGTYTLGLLDANGCTLTASVSITQPTALNVSATVLTNVACNGGTGGSASSSASGATSPYTYSWSNAESNSNATGLSAGTYSISVTDANGCTATASVSITQPTAVNVSATVLTNVLCNGGTGGIASSSASGGTSPYTYFWSNAESNSNATGLSAGTYSITVTDNNGCTGTASATITQPNALSVSAIVSANVLCNGDSNAVAASGASGGTSPYTYLWSNAESSSNATGLSAGAYTLGLTDANGCTASTSINITQPTVLSVSPSVLSNLSCNGDSSGSASSNISGGTGPYTYLWSNGGTNDTAMGLSAGTYNINVTDANGCTNSATASITQPAAIVIVPNSKPDIGHDVGAAWVNVSGGVGPYTYLWNPGGNTTDSISQKDTGTYCCMVRDSNGCEDSVCIKIKLTAGIGNITSGSGDITVYPNPNNGQFTIVIAGEAKQSQDVVEIYNVLGERVYSQYLISNSQFLINLSNQPNGIYLYRVISGSGSLLGEGKIMLQK